MNEHDCTRCRFWMNGYCYRYPQVIDVDEQRPACGEYEPAKEDAAPANDNGWISVEDRYPDSDAWVLVSAHGAVNCMAWDMRFGGWVDWTHPQAPNVLKQYITHWRPIPEPPEEKP